MHETGLPIEDKISIALCGFTKEIIVYRILQEAYNAGTSGRKVE
jgi:hypothetical protein